MEEQNIEEVKGLIGTHLYIDGQLFEGIGENELEPLPKVADSAPLELDLQKVADSATLELERQKVADSATLELELKKDEIVAALEIIRPAIEKAAEAFARFVQEFVAYATDALRKVGECAAKSWDAHMDYMLYAANERPKWWHLYKHAKKARTRKKYRRLLMKQLLNKLAATNETERRNQ